MVSGDFSRIWNLTVFIKACVKISYRMIDWISMIPISRCRRSAAKVLFWTTIITMQSILRFSSLSRHVRCMLNYYFSYWWLSFKLILCRSNAIRKSQKNRHWTLTSIIIYMITSKIILLLIKSERNNDSTEHTHVKQISGVEYLEEIILDRTVYIYNTVNWYS